MPDYKRQHYVPQFYLRNFSEDGDHVFSYHLGSKKAVRMPIKNICQSSYFYCDNGDFEKILCSLEQLQAKVIRQILSQQNFDDIDKEDFFHLLLFLLLQNTRTKQTQEVLDGFVNDFFHLCFKNELKEIDLDNPESIVATLKISHFLTMAPAMMGVELIMDLVPILIVNNTEVNFVTSDAPIVLYNYVKMKKLSLSGFQSPGLQIHCPLTEKMYLLLIDPDFYKVSFDSDSLIIIDDTSDVNALNKLQLYNCSHSLICYDQNDIAHTQHLHKSIEKTLKKTQMSVKIVGKRQLENGYYSEIFKTSVAPIDYSLKLSFLKLNHKTNKRFKSMAKRTLKKDPYTTFVRDQKAIDILDRRIENKLREAKEQLEAIT